MFVTIEPQMGQVESTLKVNKISCTCFKKKFDYFGFAYLRLRAPALTNSLHSQGITHNQGWELLPTIVM